MHDNPRRPAYLWGEAMPDRAQLVRELERLGYAPRDLTDKGDAPAGPIFVHVRDGGDEAALQQIADATDAVVAIVTAEDPQLIAVIGEAGAHGIIDLPIRRSALVIQVELARVKASYELRLKTKVILLERTLKARREIEKATQLLAAMRDISVAEAYQVLRRSAMATRKSVGETAQALLDSAEQLQSTLL